MNLAKAKCVYLPNINSTLVQAADKCFPIVFLIMYGHISKLVSIIF